MTKAQVILTKAGKMIQERLRKELQTQGHTLTGKLERSIVSRVVVTGDATVVEGVALDYAGILDAGTSPGRIPYREGSGAKTSKYIDGLFNFFKLRGLDDKEAKSAAFATAKVQKREGMSTVASHRFSKNGARQHFIELTEIALGRTIDDVVIPGLDELIEKKFNETKSETI